MDDDELQKMDAARHLLEPVAAEVVGGLLDEIRRLRASEESLLVSVLDAKASTIRSHVMEFHRVYDQPIGRVPAVPDDKTIALRVSLIGEEFCEMLDAIYPDTASQNGEIKIIRDQIQRLLVLGKPNVDLPELVDAWADLDYVVEGSRLMFGVNGEPVAAEVQRSNLSKLGADGKPVRREDGKVMKGPNFTPPDISACLKAQGWEG